MNLIDKFCLLALSGTEYGALEKSLQSLKKTEFLSREELNQISRTKLRRLLETAQKQTVYWNETLSSFKETGLFEGEVNEILGILPILTKAIIRQQGEAIWNSGLTEYIKATTGGTTGQPLAIRRDLPCHYITKAALWRGRLSWGLRPSSREVFLTSFGKISILGNLKMRLGNKRLGDAFPGTDEDVKKVLHLLRSFKPVGLEGFASGLLESVKRTKEKSDIRIPVLVSTGEMLYHHQREQLEAFYSAKVYTYYGSNEVGSIAYECEMQKLHVCEEHVVVETLNELGESVINEQGKVVVTDLDNIAMPFIRYELGDIATLSNKPCGCGRKSLVIEELQGRTQDYLSSPSGARLQATQLAAYLKDLIHIGQIQFVQTAEKQIQLKFTGDQNSAKKEIQFIKQHLANRLGNEVECIEINLKEIEKTQRGKVPLILRKLQS